MAWLTLHDQEGARTFAGSRTIRAQLQRHALAIARRLARSTHAFDLAFVAASVLALALFVYLGRRLTFFHDEWSFIDGRGSWTFQALMEPHNEHWSLGLALIYKLLLSTVGLRSYLPYLVVLLLLHVAVAAAVYSLQRKQNGAPFALAGGSLLLFLGSGYENLFWAFQVGFVGSAAAGAWAITLLVLRTDRAGLIAASGLLFVSVATQGTGLFFLVAVLVLLGLDGARRKDLWVIAPAAVAYLAWYALLGSDAVDAHRNPFTFEAIGQLPEYIVSGASNAIVAMTGLGPEFGRVGFVLLTAATAWHVMGRQPLRVLAVAGFAGLVAQYAIIGLVRAQMGPATQSRYVYVAAVFLLIVASGWVGKRFVHNAMRGYPVLAVLWTVALLGNVPTIWAGRDIFEGFAQQTRATVFVLERYGGSAAVPADEGLFPIPGSLRLTQISAMFGSPMQDALTGPIPVPPGELLDAILYRLVSDALVLRESDRPSSPSPPETSYALDVRVSAAGSCVRLVPSGPDPQVVFNVPAGVALWLTARGGGDVQVFVAVHGWPSEQNSRTFTLAPMAGYILAAPDIGSDTVWQIRLDPPGDIQTLVCQQSEHAASPNIGITGRFAGMLDPPAPA